MCGVGVVPHESIGNARRLQCDHPDNLHSKILECVENMSADTIIVDEISNRKQAMAAKAVLERGVRVIATVHGASLPSIVHDKERNVLLGGGKYSCRNVFYSSLHKLVLISQRTGSDQ